MATQVTKILQVALILVFLRFCTAVTNSKIGRWNVHLGKEVNVDIENKKLSQQRDGGIQVESKRVFLRRPRNYREKFEKELIRLEKRTGNGQLLQSDLDRKKTALKTNVELFKSDVLELQTFTEKQPLSDSGEEKKKTSLQTDLQLLEHDNEEIKQAMENKTFDRETIDEDYQFFNFEDPKKKKTKGNNTKKWKREWKGKEKRQGGKVRPDKGTEMVFASQAPSKISIAQRSTKKSQVDGIGEYITTNYRKGIGNAPMACETKFVCKPITIRGRVYSLCRKVSRCSNIG